MTPTPCRRTWSARRSWPDGTGKGDLAEAADVLDKALDHNADSHYLANLLGEISLEAGDIDQSRAAFQRSLTIIGELEKRRESNVWTNASAANAAFVLGEDDRAASLLKAAAAMHPDSGSLATIERGLRGLAARLNRGDDACCSSSAHCAPESSCPIPICHAFLVEWSTRLMKRMVAPSGAVYNSPSA